MMCLSNDPFTENPELAKDAARAKYTDVRLIDKRLYSVSRLPNMEK
jgi:hypothetical protein